MTDDIIREQFEKKFPPHRGLVYSEFMRCYVANRFDAVGEIARTFNRMLDVWRAAHNQSGTPKAWLVSHPDRGWVVYHHYPDWAEGEFEIKPLFESIVYTKA